MQREGDGETRPVRALAARREENSFSFDHSHKKKERETLVFRYLQHFGAVIIVDLRPLMKYLIWAAMVGDADSEELLGLAVRSKDARPIARTSIGTA